MTTLAFKIRLVVRTISFTAHSTSLQLLHSLSAIWQQLFTVLGWACMIRHVELYYCYLLLTAVALNYALSKQQQQQQHSH
jgi:homoserine trans-succinylase